MWMVDKRYKGICPCENLCEKIFAKSAKIRKIQIELFRQFIVLMKSW